METRSFFSDFYWRYGMKLGIVTGKKSLEVVTSAVQKSTIRLPRKF
jgi:hypothetical protein